MPIFLSSSSVIQILSSAHSFSCHHRAASRSQKTVFFPQLISAHFALSKIITIFICAF
jgi:hypothetical protein